MDTLTLLTSSSFGSLPVDFVRGQKAIRFLSEGWRDAVVAQLSAGWRALEAKISRAYAPMVVAPLAAVVVADAVVDAGAALAARMLDETGVCVVHLAAHCSAAPPDSEMHALGAFAAGAPPQAYVLSARGPKRKIRYPLYREGPIDRNARDATRDLFAARVKGASNWAKALETVVEFIASKGI